MHSIEIATYYWIKSTWMICRASLSRGHNEVHIGGINVRNGTPLALCSDHAITVALSESKMY